MLMMIMYINPFFFNHWKLSISLILTSFFFFLIPLNFYSSYLSMNMGCDMYSYLLILLSVIIFSFSILSSNKFMNKKKLFFLIIILLKMLYFSFLFTNFLLFYLFFEMSLIPMIMIIMGWGMKVERIKASLYFLFYTLLLSLPLLFFLMLFFNMNMSYFYFFNFYTMKYNMMFTTCFLMAFLVKLPMYGFHLWLPKAHVESPVMGSMILAGILLKLGGYGIIRILYIVFEEINKLNWMVISFSIWGGLMISFFCFNQMDMKMIVAFSSISHMSLLIGGMFSNYNLSINSSMIMMISHGLTSSGMFFMVNVFYERTKSRSLLKNKGLSNMSSNMSLCSFLIISSSMGVPPSINLMSELLLIYNMLYVNIYLYMMLFFMLLLSVMYSMYMYSFSFQGKIFSGMFFFKEIFLIDYLIMIMHWLPSILLILKVNFLTVF